MAKQCQCSRKNLNARNGSLLAPKRQRKVIKSLPRVTSTRSFIVSSKIRNSVDLSSYFDDNYEFEPRQLNTAERFYFENLSKMRDEDEEVKTQSGF